MRKTLTLLAAISVLAACHEEKPDNFEPQLYIGTATDITRNEATLTGEIVKQGNTPMPDLRFIYGSQEDMSLVSPNVETDAEGHVTVRLTGLDAGTPYSFCLQGNNGRVTLSSDIGAFTTLPNEKPQLYIGTATDITRNEATLIGQIVIQDDLPLPDLYFEYGPQEDLCFTSPSVETDAEGRVSVRLNSLTSGTSYSFRLQGQDENGTLTSETGTFTTLPEEPPTVGSLTLVSLGPASTIVSYEILSAGSKEVTESGCYVEKLPSGNIVKHTASSTTGICQVHIGGLEQHSSYRIQPYASSEAGETKGEVLEITTSDAVVWNEPGGLTALMGEDLYRFTSLSFDGPMNGDDLRTLRKMMGRETDGSATGGQLSHVNLSDADIVSGGGNYDDAHYSADNVVGKELFAGCDRLEYIALPNSATVIEKDAFLNCSSLNRLDIPAYAESVIPSDGCTGLEEINISPANTHYQCKDGVLFNADLTEIVWFPIAKDGEYELPGTITSLDDYAFQGCHITRFILPEGVKELGQGVFYGSEIEEVVTPSTLRAIPTATFQGCTSLKTVRLGRNTELISDYAFDDSPLENLYVEAIYPPVCNHDAFSTSYGNLFEKCILHVPANRLGFYKADSHWGQFTHIIEIK